MLNFFAEEIINQGKVQQHVTVMIQKCEVCAVRANWKEKIKVNLLGMIVGNMWNVIIRLGDHLLSKLEHLGSEKVCS